MRMELSEKYLVRGKDVVHKEIESESVLLNLDSGNYYTLNKTGSFVWSLVDGKKNITDIVGQIVDRFDVDREEAGRDAETLIKDLIAEGLIQLSDEPG